MKYTVGNAMLHGQNMGSMLAADASSIEFEFPVISTDGGSGNGNYGSGVDDGALGAFGLSFGTR